MGPTHRRRAPCVTGIKSCVSSTNAFPRLNVVPQRNLSPAKRTFCPDANTPEAVDECDSGMDDISCRYPLTRSSVQYRRSQHMLGFDRFGASTTISALAASAATITDTEDDDVSLLKQSKSVYRRHRQKKSAFKIRNKYIQKSALQPMISRSSLRSATISGSIQGPLTGTLVLEQAAAADSNPGEVRLCPRKRVEVKIPRDPVQKRSIHPTTSSVPPATSERPKRYRIPTDFFKPSFKYSINSTGSNKDCRSLGKIMNSIPSIASTDPKEGTVQDRPRKSSSRTMSFLNVDVPTTTTSAATSGLALVKRNRVPTNFYRPIVPIMNDTQKYLAVSISLDKKKEHGDATLETKETHKRLSRSHGDFIITVVASGRDNCKRAPVRLTLGRLYAKRPAAMSSLSQTRCVRLPDNRRLRAQQTNSEPTYLSAPATVSFEMNTNKSDEAIGGCCRNKRRSVATRNKLLKSIPFLDCAHISTRSRSSRVLKGDSASSPPNPSFLVRSLDGNVSGVQELLKNKSSISSLSHDSLLSQYNDKVSQGLCHRVHFGRTLKSALAGVDRMFQEMAKQVSDDIIDLDVLADTREYKRSLRFFSIYEDREKLALFHEAQEDMATVGQSWSKPNQSFAGKGRSELHLLGDRPVVFRSSCFLSRRCNLQCRSGPSCIICGSCSLSESPIVSSTSAYTPIPMIEPFDIDDDSDTEVASAVSFKKRKRKIIQHNSMAKATMDALTELKNSLAFVEQYNDRSTFQN